MFILEGNIGAGKSTLINAVKKHLPEISAFQEQADNWITLKEGQSLLKNFYNNPKRWAYTLETYALLCRVKDHLKEQQNPNKKRLWERSIYSSHFCFSKNDFINKYMSPIEWHAVQTWFNFLTEDKCLPPLGFIYLKTDPQISLDRVKKRKRPSESSITLDYLTQVHERHLELFINQTKDVPTYISNAPVLVLNANQDFENSNLLFDHLDKISNFVEENHQKYLLLGNNTAKQSSILTI